MTRKQRLKDLMKERTTVEQGLTLRQIFCEVYSDVVEEYRVKKWDTGQSMLDDQYLEKKRYLKRLVKHIRKTDDAFRWLCLVPYRDERGKIKQDRYVNIKPNDSYGEQLLEEVNAFWLKHAQGSLSGLEHSKTRLERIAEIPEEAIQKSLDQHVAFIKYEVLVHKCSNDKAINRMVAELKKAANFRSHTSQIIDNLERFWKRNY